jgi:xanthine dehydrogenase/oxidase
MQNGSDGCCMSQKKEGNGIITNGDARKTVTEVTETLFDPSEFKPYDPSQDPIFPPELRVRSLN